MAVCRRQVTQAQFLGRRTGSKITQGLTGATRSCRVPRCAVHWCPAADSELAAAAGGLVRIRKCDAAGAPPRDRELGRAGPRAVDLDTDIHSRYIFTAIDLPRTYMYCR
jgi:hypothetical protein